MIDLITYTPNLTALRASIKSKVGENPLVVEDDEGNTWLNYPAQVPVKSRNNHSVSVVRINAEDKSFLESLNTLEILSETSSGDPWDNIRGNQGKTDKIELAHDRTTVVVKDPSGNNVNYTPSLEIGMIAGDPNG